MKKIIYLFVVLSLSACYSDSGTDFNLGSGDGISAVSGSLASFTIVDNYLYVVSANGLTVLDVSARRLPRVINEVSISNTVETIFSYNESLLLGTRQGMLIYDISIRDSPTFLAEISHQTACDPVIARADVAYVTIRDGFNCNALFEANQLVVIDIEDLSEPIEITQIARPNPRGLAIISSKLFIGEGDFGLSQFDISDPRAPIFEKLYSEIQANDMIAVGTNLVITGSTGITQYDLQADELNFLSQIQ